MKIQKLIRSILIWLPSITISLIFIQNGLLKIFQSDGMDKVIQNKAVLMAVGFILLLATALFLFNKTIIWGATVMALYMTCITFIHISKDKPFEVVALIVLGIAFAAYIRKPEIFHPKQDTLKA